MAIRRKGTKGRSRPSSRTSGRPRKRALGAQARKSSSGVMAVALPESLAQVLYTIAIKFYNNFGRAGSTANDAVADAVCLAVTDGNKRAAAALKKKAVQGHEEYVSLLPQAGMKFTP